MRTLTRLRVRPVPCQFQSSLSSRRHYSLLLTSTTRTRTTLTTPTIRRPTLFHLHPKTPIQNRTFSLIPLLETAVTASQSALTSLHTLTSTPWYLTIPLFALALNLVTRLPSAIYTRRLVVSRAKLNPLSMAYGARARHDLAKEATAGAKAATEGGTGTGMALGQAKLMARYMKMNRAEAKERDKRWGTQTWKGYAPALGVFPVWMLGIEALRRMCGGPWGLVGRVMFGLKAVEEGGEGMKGEGGVVVGGEGQGVIQDTALAAGSGAESSVSAAAPAATALEAPQEGLLAASTHVDLTMATEGCLWFPDLLVADPYHILPIALSVIMVANVLPKSAAGLRALANMNQKAGVVMVQNKWQLRFQRVLLVVAALIGPLTMYLPAALHLYWVSSATLTLIETSVIAWLMPLPKIAPPAKGIEDIFVMPKREEAKSS